MCGIVGTTRPEECPSQTFDLMVDALAHRGPDDRGVYRDGRVALGHRRLSILDLSERGHQPMVATSGDVVVVYNGECYNHLSLRRRLDDVAWQSNCDTETLLRLYEREGPGFIRLVEGMFALALYDRRLAKLYLYRDRMGEKPLYVFFDKTCLMFASELKALRPHPRFSREIDPVALRDYFLFNYIPAPRSIHKNTAKLRPGWMAEYDLVKHRLSESPYWSISSIVEKSREGKHPGPNEAGHELERLLRRSVRQRTLSDVPLGCFLSGGIDSTAVAWALSRESRGEVNTFTIGFREEAYDESGPARQVARFLGTNHREKVVGPKEFLRIVSQLPRLYDEPFADASAIPTAVLAEWTRRHVTVALSGDGGDELFLGYDRYRWAEEVARFFKGFPNGLRRTLAAMGARLPHYRLQMISRGLEYSGPNALYPFVFTGWNAEFVRRVLRVPLEMNRHAITELGRGGRSPGEKGSLTDLVHYLPDDILVKVDRATMAHGLEARAPFLDHRLVEFAVSLPLRYRMNGGVQKILLRRLLRRHIPEEILRRPKAGFAVPLKRWFRRELAAPLRHALAPSRLRRHGLFDEKYVQELLARHRSGRYNHERQLWALYMFQLWYEEGMS